MATLFPVINFKNWIEENRHLLKPPVGNKQIWKDGEFIAMVVGGPNSRKDYHINGTSEFFYQVEGDMVLKIIVDGESQDVHIREGDLYLLPPNIPHSPRRPANTIGLVIEQQRPEGMIDGLVWHCENCNTKLFQDSFSLDNIETDLKIAFDKFFSDKEKTTCTNCGNVMQRPQ